MLTHSKHKNIDHIPLSSNIEIIIVMAMLNFVIYITTLSCAEGHKYQFVLFSTKHTSVCKQRSESLVRCKTSVGYSHKNIDYIPLSSNINIFTGRMLGFVIYIKISWHELPDFCCMHNNVMNSHL